VAVLWHDRFLGKVGFPIKHIDDFDLAQLQAMDFAAHFSSGAKPEGIMSLKEFLDAYRKRCRLLLEIKNRDWEKSSRHEIKVRQTLDMAGAARGDAILVSSFDLDSLVYAHQCAPNFPLVYNLETDQTLADAQRVLAEQPFLHGLCLPIKSLDEAFVKLLRDDGKSIAVYTCNSDAEIGKALGLGVDILISDVPQKALQMRDR
jgi:glycerophosphoryl diester phosphodiesterase